jgi:pimeloyl-ACP methyl ester carboxylesterase
MKRREFVALAAAAPALAAAAPAVDRDSRSAVARTRQQAFTFYSPLSEEWYQGGDYFTWTSTTLNNNAREVEVFYRTFGDRSNPAILLVHGYPTSSFDFRELIGLLQDDYLLCTLDFPGFGFSDKPLDGYSYMLRDDARLLDHFVRDIVGLDSFHLLTHDRGVSVGLAFLGDYLDATQRAYEITYHFMSNSGSFLPLANLGDGQRAVLDPVRGPELTAAQRARPRVTEGNPVSVAYQDMFAFNDGIGARLHVGKYLLERAANEYRWLSNLKESPIPTALFWGLADTVNPPRIADHIWMTYLNDRDVESSFWLLPTAGHYPQRDEPAAVEFVVRACLEGRVPTLEEEDAFMRVIARERTTLASPVYVGHSHIRDIQFPGAVEYTPAGYR